MAGVAARSGGCGGAAGAPIARVTLQEAPPAAASGLECRFALVDESAAAWEEAWDVAAGAGPGARAIPLGGNITSDDEFWRRVRARVSEVEGLEGAAAFVSARAERDALDVTAVTCEIPPVAAHFAGAPDAGALAVTVAWIEADASASLVEGSPGAPAPDAANENDAPALSVARPALSDPDALVRFAGAETAPLAVAPSAFGAVEWGDLVLVEGAGFPPAAALECAFEGSEPEVSVELTGSTGGDASSETGGVASARVLENGGDPAATRFARATPRRAGETLDAARAACAPPPAGFLLDRITLRWRGVVLAAEGFLCPDGGDPDPAPGSSIAATSASRVPAPRVMLRAHEFLVPESAGEVRVEVSLDARFAGALAPVTARVELRDVTATAGEDHGGFVDAETNARDGAGEGDAKTSVEVTWPAGAPAGAARTLVVPIVDDDRHEGEEDARLGGDLDGGGVPSDGAVGAHDAAPGSSATAPPSPPRAERFEVVVASTTWSAVVADAPRDAAALISVVDDDPPPTFEVRAGTVAHRPHPATNAAGADAGGALPLTTPPEGAGTPLLAASSPLPPYADVRATGDRAAALEYFAARNEALERRERERRAAWTPPAGDPSAVEYVPTPVRVARVAGAPSRRGPAVLRYETVHAPRERAASDGFLGLGLGQRAEYFASASGADSHARPQEPPKVLGVSGEMTLDADASFAELFVPVAWSLVRDYDDISVGVRLAALENARAPVNDAAEAAALRVIGVEEGACPRGFERPSPAAAREARLASLDVAGSTSRSSTAGTETPTPLDLDPPFHPSRLSYRVAVPSVSSDGAAVDGVAFSVAPFDARAAVEVRVEGYPDAASSVRRADETPDRSFQSFAVSLPARPLAPATRALVIVRAVDAASGLNVTETYEVSFDDADGFVDDAREGTEAEGTEASALAPESASDAASSSSAPSSEEDSGSSSVCVACALGWFSETPDATACHPCPAGAAPDARKTTCEACAPGWYSRREARHRCSPCIVGTRAASEGSDACDACPPGTWTRDEDAATACEAEPGEEESGGDGRGDADLRDSSRTTIRTDVAIVANFALEFPAGEEDEAHEDGGRSGVPSLALADAAGVRGTDGATFTDAYVVTQLVRSDCARAFGVPVSRVAATIRIVGEEAEAEAEPSEEATRRRRLRGEEEGEEEEGSEGEGEGSSGGSSKTKTRRVKIASEVAAVLESHFPPGTDEDDIAAAIEVQRLNADLAVGLLGDDPDAFFGHTTDVLGEKGAIRTTVTSAAASTASVLAPGNPDDADDPGAPDAAEAVVFVAVGACLLAFTVGGRRVVSCVRGSLPGARRSPSPPRVVRGGGRPGGAAEGRAERRRGFHRATRGRGRGGERGEALSSAAGGRAFPPRRLPFAGGDPNPFARLHDENVEEGTRPRASDGAVRVEDVAEGDRLTRSAHRRTSSRGASAQDLTALDGVV